MAPWLVCQAALVQKLWKILPCLPLAPWKNSLLSDMQEINTDLFQKYCIVDQYQDLPHRINSVQDLVWVMVMVPPAAGVVPF